MGGYGGEILRYTGEKLAGLGEWFKQVGHNITHDPVWGGVTIGIVLLMLLLVFAKRRAGG